MGHLEHKASAHGKQLRVFVITMSDTRNKDSDESGNYIKERFLSASHLICGYRVIKDDRDSLESAIVEICDSSGENKTADAVIINGGTGISYRDITYDVLKELYDKELFGFGEIFRQLSFAEIGTSAIMSRASAGIYNGVAVFSIPGSLNAVKLAVDDIILKEIAHISYEISKHSSN